VDKQGLSKTIKRYPIILKAKFGANFVTSLSWQKMLKLELNHETVQNEFYIAA